MKIYDTIRHRSYEIWPDEVDFDKTKVSFVRTGEYWVVLKPKYWHKSPNRVGVLSVTFNTWHKICYPSSYDLNNW